MAASERHGAALVTHDADVRLARLLAWISLGWMTVEGAVGIAAGIAAGSVALVGFGLDSAIEGFASVIVIWRFTGTRVHSETSERRAQKLVAASFLLLAPYVAFEATRDLVTGSHAETSWIGIALALVSLVGMPLLGRAKQRLGMRLDSAATAGEGTQNMLCAYLAAALLVGLVGNAAFGAWWLDPVAAFVIAGVALDEGRELWQGEDCGCH
ncbi:MAG TPA: cation transporter [Thermoleophilaceae bacterium]|nr:cation transporter [Thermoleophilaceae bacterium]